MAGKKSVKVKVLHVPCTVCISEFYVSIFIHVHLYVFVYCRRTQLESEEIVADLVHCFLIPEVKKQTVREKGKHFYNRSQIHILFRLPSW